MSRSGATIRSRNISTISQGSGVTKSVYVQTNWANDRFEDETAWVQQTANEHGWPHAIVSFADFNVDDVRPQLDRLARYPLVRGVRMQLHWHENPLYRFAARPDLCADPKIRRNVARLADYGWSFDLQVFAPQMADAADLAEACPEGDLHPAARGHAGRPLAARPRRLARRHGAARALPERRLEAFGTWHLHPSQRSPRTSPISSTTRSRSSAPNAACSARIFRSKSSGPAIATSSTPIAPLRRGFARTARRDFRDHRHARLSACRDTTPQAR